VRRETAISIAQACAQLKPEKYYAEPFMPHEWVIDAILAVASCPRAADFDIDRLKADVALLRELIMDTRFYLQRQSLDGVFRNTRWWDLITPALRDRLDAVSLGDGGLSATSSAEPVRTIDVLSPSLPLLLHCPMCGARHIDEGEQATKPHRTHACQLCGHLWAPAVVETVGVRFLPGCKNEDGTAGELFDDPERAIARMRQLEHPKKYDRK
jgi:hypothetical protein